MAIFKQKNPEEEVEETSFSQSARNRWEKFAPKHPLSRKKEPPKPWTSRDRYLVSIVLGTTLITSILLALSAREWKLPRLSRLALPKLELSIFKGGTIVIKGDNKAKDLKLKVQEEKIVSEFKDIIEGLSGVYGLYVVDLGTGYSFGVNEEEVFEAASLIKLPVMAGMYLNHELGIINLDSKYTLKNVDKVSGAGSLYSKPEGYEITYRNLVSLMGKQSDNTAFNVTKKLLGGEKFNEVTKKIGMQKTSLADNETTPRDIGVFFEELYKGNIVNEKDKNELLDSLTDTLYEQWLKAGIADNVRLAHKYGREVHVVNDGGIVFSENPFVVVVLSKGVVEREADEVFPKLARIVYDNMVGN